MIRPIRLTEALINECVEDFRKSITESRMYSGELTYKQTFKWEGKMPPAHVVFSTVAYLKMCALLRNFESEVAWHCTVKRDENTPEVFHVLDVFVSPQEVTGVTVNSDQQKYEQWLCSLDDEVFNNLHMQCHSHVNMGVTPSSTDKTHWSGVLNALVDEGDVFYIFMIWNKKMEYTVQVYDMNSNTYYDGTDVIVDLEGSEFDLGQFLKDSKSVVTTKTFAQPAASGYHGTHYQGSYSGKNKVEGKPITEPAKTGGGSVESFSEAKKVYGSGSKDRDAEVKKRKESKSGSSGYYGSRYGYYDDEDLYDSYWSK